MSKIKLTPSRGRSTAGDQLALPPDTLERCIDGILMPDDKESIFKHPGRTSAGELPTSTLIKDLVHAGYNTQDILVLLANSRLYEANAGTTLGAWTTVADQAAAAFSRTGSWLRTIPDGQRRAIFWTGALSERPLLRDEDGNWRFLSLKKPDDSTALSATASTPTVIRPDAATHPATCSEGTVTANLDNEANAYDGVSTTYASKYLTTAGIVCTDYEFTDGGGTSTTGYKLNIRAATSSLPPGDVELPADRRTSESVHAYLMLQVSTDNGSTFTTVFSQSVPVADTLVQYSLPDNISWVNIIVRVLFRYTSGTIKAGVLATDVWAQEAAAGSASVQAAGTYYYSVVEQFSITLASGRTYVAYSAPTKTVSVDLNGTTHTGVVLTLPARANLDSDGVASSGSTKILKRLIYRSTSTGTYPDLGVVGEATIDATTFTDTFEVSGTTLGSPGLAVIYVGDTVYPFYGQAPAFLDACVHDGSVIAIDRNNPYGFCWTPRGFPEAYPVPQATDALPTFRNDEAKGVESLGDETGFLLFQRTRVLRVRGLPMAAEPNFNIGNLQITTISPNRGLAGSPLSKTMLQSQRGHAMAVWVSDDGIYGTDGSLPSERGMGCVKLSNRFNWQRLVDPTRLTETRLTYDPILQLLIFDYFDRAGEAQTEYFHTAPVHWEPSGEDQLVPRCTGPHTFTATARAVGENQGVLRHWTLNAADGLVYNERTGTGRAGARFWTPIEWGWQYPGGPDADVQFYGGTVSHSDWGAGEALDVELLSREDDSGIIQPSRSAGVPLRGLRKSDLGEVVGAGTSFKVILRHFGYTTSEGTPVRSIGEVVLDAELVSDDARS